jgi:hypothetical protein
MDYSRGERKPRTEKRIEAIGTADEWGGPGFTQIDDAESWVVVGRAFCPKASFCE